jgi:hypothetical protein
MLHLPFLPHHNRDGLVLGRLWRFPISPLFRVTASARTAHMYVIGMSGKSKSKPLEWCIYQDIAAGRGCGLIDPHFLLAIALEFVSQYVDLKPTARGAIGLCPFHDDHHPSFGVNDEGNYWHCFAGCGGGSVIDFWMKWQGWKAKGRGATHGSGPLSRLSSMQAVRLHLTPA